MQVGDWARAFEWTQSLQPSKVKDVHVRYAQHLQATGQPMLVHVVALPTQTKHRAAG